MDGSAQQSLSSTAVALTPQLSCPVNCLSVTCLTGLFAKYILLNIKKAYADSKKQNTLANFKEKSI